MYVFERDAPSTRWISVVFLQGDEAEELLTLIERDGPISAIYQLQEFDRGDATVESALANGYVYDSVPAGSTDHTLEPFGSPYALTYSSTFGYVSLLRRYEPELEPAHASPMQPAAAGSSRRADDIWQPGVHPRRSPAAHSVAL